MKKDDVFKKLFSDKKIFLMLLKDFIKENWIQEIAEEKLELIPSLYTDGIETNRESDIIYKIKYKNEDIFVFILLEHQSKVDYLMSFRILEYMVKLWRKYIDDQGKSAKNKSFKLPPIFPIVFYDGFANWTSAKEFQEKVKDKEKFEKYIPKFEYEIINLNEITFEELEKYEDLLSAILLIDKIKKPEDLAAIRELGSEYWKKLQKNVNGVRELEKIAEAINLLLMRINTPKEEREKVVEEIYQGRLNKMFEMAVNYDVQETRRIAMEEGLSQGISQGLSQGISQGLSQGLNQGLSQGIQKEKIEVVKNAYKQNIDLNIISNITGLTFKEIKKIINENKID